MTEVEKLRALLAEARAGYIGHNLDCSTNVCDECSLAARIDAALAEPVNQCDGCNIGAPKNERGHHVYPSGVRVGCDADRYALAEPVVVHPSNLTAQERDEARAEVERLRSSLEKSPETERWARVRKQVHEDEYALRLRAEHERAEARAEVQELQDALTVEREWTALLAKDNGVFIQQLDDVASAIGIKGRTDITPLVEPIKKIKQRRDAAKAEVERLKAELDEKSGYLAAVEKLIPYEDYISDKTCAENVEVVLRRAYRRGAEAMREAAIRACEEPQMGTEADAIRALPVPEDK